VTRIRAGWPGFDYRQEQRRDFVFLLSLCHLIQTGFWPHSASYPMGTGNKAARAWSRETPPYNAEFKNAWSYTTTPQYVFMAWYL